MLSVCLECETHSERLPVVGSSRTADAEATPLPVDRFESSSEFLLGMTCSNTLALTLPSVHGVKLP